MWLNPQQIQELIDLIDTHHLRFAAEHITTDYLTPEEIRRLKAMGIDPKTINPTVDDAFRFGMMSEALGDDAKKMSFDQLKTHLRSKQFLPLDFREQQALQTLKYQAYHEIRGLGNRITSDLQRIMVEVDRAQRADYEKVIREAAEKTIVDRGSVKMMASEIGERTGDWARDLDRISDFVLHNAHDYGRAMQIRRDEEDPKNPKVKAKVYKHVFDQACPYCVKLYLTDGPGTQPRVFTIDQLLSNGTNIGRKQQDWKPVIGATHPWCFSNPNVKVYTSNGWVSIKDINVGDEVLTHKGRLRKVTQLLNRENDKSEDVYNIECIVNGKPVSIKGVTGSHPFQSDKGWVGLNELKVGDTLTLLTDECAGCGDRVPVFKYNNYYDSSTYCSKSCCERHQAKKQWSRDGMREKMSEAVSSGNKKRYENSTSEERKAITEKAREVFRKKYPDNSSPFFSAQTRVAANKSNGKKRTFIQRKLEYWLDSMGVDYLIDKTIFRNELRKNGQRRCYFPDIYIPELNVVIEADGDKWHDSKKDAKRDRDIKKLIGADTFRFKENDIINNGDKCYNRIKRIVHNHKGLYGFTEVVLEKKEISKTQGSTLYNFSVEDDESYIVNGLVVHNCRCQLESLGTGEYEWDDQAKEFKRVLSERAKRIREQIKVRIVES